ncbi:MAG: hypothetical protein WCX61_05210 [Candidatus Peribacteraceae bacterium]|jgi:hypothetical protein
MYRRYIIAGLTGIIAALTTVATPTAHATFSVGGWLAGNVTVDIMIGNVVNVLMRTGYWVCASIFLVGAFMYTISTGEETRKSLGKSMMMGSVIGGAIISGAKMIMSTVLFFIYG